jgi:hypothetical protein
MFGTDINSLWLENTVLLQTGLVDTTDEDPPIPVAIVIINHKEIILRLVSKSEVKNTTSRLYQEDGYKLCFHYTIKPGNHNEPIFSGSFTI